MPSGRSAGSLGGPASAPPPRLCYDAVLPTPERSRILPGPCEGPSGLGQPPGSGGAASGPLWFTRGLQLRGLRPRAAAPGCGQRGRSDTGPQGHAPGPGKGSGGYGRETGSDFREETAPWALRALAGGAHFPGQGYGQGPLCCGPRQLRWVPSAHPSLLLGAAHGPPLPPTPPARSPGCRGGGWAQP